VLAAGLFAFAVIRYLRYRQQNRERERRLERIMNQYRALQEEMDSRQLSAPKSAPANYSLPEPEITDPDKDLMNRLMGFIEQHLADEALRIEDMADAVGLGRTVFYHKIKELLGVSPSDFLKQVRMERAEQLVAKSRQTFSEIAYNVGFNDPKYFTKCFKKQTGMTPSEYRNAKQKESATPS
jgi:AraC-like DNA-binding protein